MITLLFLLFWSILGFLVFLGIIETFIEGKKNSKLLVIFALCGPFSWLVFAFCVLVSFVSSVMSFGEKIKPTLTRWINE